MSQFTDKITLLKNARGVYDIDTIKGCVHGTALNDNGCYGDCYAVRYSRRYGYNFCKPTLRRIYDLKHLELIRDQIMSIDMPFIRVGVSGDPSENWSHTIGVIKLINGCGKTIVIVTKHWTALTDSQIKTLSRLKVCFNTSISALDSPGLLKHRISQHNRIRRYCKSILRIVSCDFNKDNLTGLVLDGVQSKLFALSPVIDNVLRVSLKNELIVMGIIKARRVDFMGGKSYISMMDNDTFIGYCRDCPDMCGLNL